MEGRDESKEDAIVTTTDASSKPQAVVVEPKDAVVAFMAVSCPQRPEHVADLAVLEPPNECIPANRAIHLWHKVLDLVSHALRGIAVRWIDLLKDFVVVLTLRNDSWFL